MSETGHAKNVGNFETLVTSCAGFGAAYNPSNPNLEVLFLTARHNAAQLAMDAVATALADQKVEINNRQTGFEGIRRLVTRVVNAFEAGGAPAKDVEDARGFKRKLDGARAKALETPGPGEPPDTVEHKSVSQQSYVQLVEHFAGLIELLKKSTYAPNEVELQIAELETKRDDLEAANSNVITKLNAADNARIERDKELYQEPDGLVPLAGLVKKYVKSLFGADSPQYGQISGLKFTKP